MAEGETAEAKSDPKQTSAWLVGASQIGLAQNVLARGLPDLPCVRIVVELQTGNIEGCQPEPIRVRAIAGRRIGTVVAGIAEIIEAVRKGFRAGLGAAAFRNVPMVCWNIVDRPMPERSRWGIRILHDENVALRICWRITPLEEWREVLASAGVAMRNRLATIEGRTAQFKGHYAGTDECGRYASETSGALHGSTPSGDRCDRTFLAPQVLERQLTCRVEPEGA